ncbi:MAG TPA: RraA family protein [Vicinamibacterales bacterium]|nr:RraA family protein [Vicinamibacterales bacterium]
MTDYVARLQALDACAVSDALDKLGLAGVVTGIHRCSTDRRISGRVVTVKLEPDDGRPAASRHLSTAAVEMAGPGDVIVVEQRTGIDAAAWGGNLSLGAKLRGIEGVIVDGPTRDVDEARAYDFPVFARDHTSRTARGRLVETGTNVPIRVGDVPVSPGDYVVADGSAVVFVAAGEIERVLAAAEAIAARERAMAASLRQGTPISRVMDVTYETMLRRDG